MARRINKPLVGWLTLLGAGGVITVATAVIIRLRPEDPRPFIEIAERHAAKAEYRKAAAMYGRAATISRDAGSLALAGQMWLLDGNLEMARATWEAGKTMDPTSPAPRESSLRFLLDFSEVTNAISGWQAVEREARELLALIPNHAEALHALALALRQLPKQESTDQEILVSLQRAVSLKPTCVAFSLDLANVLENRGLNLEAEAVLREACAQVTEPGVDSVRLRCGLGMFFGRNNRLSEAKQAFDQSLELAGNDAMARSLALRHLARYYLSAAVLRREGAPESAEEREAETAALAALEEAVALNKDDFDAFLELGKLYLQLSRHENALRLAETRLAAHSTVTGLGRYQAKARLYESSLLAAEACIAMATRKELEPAERDRWVSRALDFISRAQVEWSDGPRGHLLEGEARLLQGRVRDALASLVKADSRYAQTGRISWKVKTLMARLHLELNEAGAAMRVLEGVQEQARRENPTDPVFWTLYAEALVRNQRPEEALELIDAVLKAAPDHDPARRVKLAALTMLNRVAETAALAAELDETGATAALLRARSLIADEQFAPAYEVLADHLDKYSGHLAVLREAVLIAARAGQEEDARRRVAEATRSAPNEQELRRFAIILDPSMTDAQRHEVMLGLIREDPDPLSRALRLLNYHAARSEDARVLDVAKEAVSVLNEVSGKLSEADRRTLLQLVKRRELNAAAHLKDWSRAEQIVEFAAQQRLDEAEGNIFKGELKVLREDYAGAVSALQEAVRLHPTHSYALTLLGASCHELGRLSDAKAFLQRAVDANPGNALAQRGLAIVADRLNDTPLYDKALEACARLIPTDSWVAEQLLLRADEREPQEALERRRKILETEPNNVRNLLQMARLCQRLKRIGEADQYFAEALRLSPRTQEVVFKTADHYLMTRRASEGERVILAFIESQNSDAGRANAMLTLAAFYLRSGRVDEGERVLLDAANLAPTFEVCLSLGDFYFQQKRSPMQAATWFEKAQSLAQIEQNPRWIEALVRRLHCALDPAVYDLPAATQLLHKARAAYPDLADWVYWSATIAGLEGRPDEAVALLNQFLLARPDDSAGQFARAQHLMWQGLWPSAIQDLERLKSRDPGALDLRPRIQLAYAYENSGRSEAALRELESLVAEFPNSFEAARELAAALVRADRIADAQRMVTQQVNRYADIRAAPWLRMRAELHRRRGDEAAALADDRRASELQGHTSEDVARILGGYLRQGRPADAVAFYEEVAAGRTLTGPTQALYAQALHAAGRREDGYSAYADALAQALEESFASTMRVMRAAAQTYTDGDRRTPFLSALTSQPVPSLMRALFECGFDENSGDWRSAVRRLETLISDEQATPHRPTIRRILAMTCHAQGDVEGAIRAYAAILEESPADTVSLNNLANLFASSGRDLDRAEALARRAVAASFGGGFRADAQDTLGWILTMQGRFPEAIAALTLAMRLDPENPNFRYHLGETYRRNRQFELAVHLLNTAARDAEKAGNAELTEKARTSAERAVNNDAAP